MMFTDDGEARNKRSMQGIDPRVPFRAVLNGGLASAHWLFVRHGALSGAVSIIVFLVGMLAFAWLRPVHNWDSLAYLGVVARDFMGLTDPAAIHAFAYDTVREATKPEQYAILTQNDVYRERMASDPQAFVSMLGMYDVKWLYVTLLAWLGPSTGAYKAGFIVNCIAAALMSASVIRWLQAIGMLHFGIAVPALLMVAGLPGFAMVNIPDFLALSLMTAAVLAFDRDRLVLGGAALVLAVMTRPEALIFSGVLMCAAWFWNDRRLAWAAALTFLVASVVFLAIENTSTSPGWWPHFWFSTYHMVHDLTGFAPDFSFKVYVTGVIYNIARSALENSWLGMYVAALGGWALMQGQKVRLADRRHVLVGALLFGLAVKFLVFPLHDGRVHMPYLFPAILLLLAGATGAMRGMAKAR